MMSFFVCSGRVARVLMFDLNSGRGRCVQELLILLLVGIPRH